MLTRPPPLQLQYDNTRLGLELAPQPETLKVDSKKGPGYRCQISTFLAKVYQANWRNLVIGVAAINALRFLISALTSFHDLSVDIKSHRPSRLSQFSLALGALYLATAILQFYGAISAALQRISLIRVYVHLAFLSALLITITGFVTAVEYFLLAEDIIGECVDLSISGSWVSKSIFRGKLNHGKVPNNKIAQEQCLSAWSRGSVSQIISVVVFYFIPAFAFFLLAYIYYRQTVDPMHPANLLFTGEGSGGDVEAIRLEAYPHVRYSPVYQDEPGNGRSRGETVVRSRTPRGPNARAASVTNANANANTIANNNNSRSHQSGANVVKPQTTKMQRLLQLTPVMRTGSPYGISPGPPSFGQRGGHGYGYEYGNVWFGGRTGHE